MAIESYGYPKTIAAGDVYATVQRLAGKRYAAAGPTDFEVTKAATGTRQADIDDGDLMGKGVLVKNTAPRTLNLPAPAGTSQWFAIVVNRWTDNPDPDPEAVPYLSTITSVAGSTSRAIPALTTSDGGALDQDPIALCRVTSSSTLIQEVVDLRLISVEGAGFYVAHSDLAMFRLNNVAGAEVYRTDEQIFYKRVAGPTGTLSWKNLSVPDAELSGLSATQLVDGSGWARAATCKMVREGKHRSLILEANRTGGASNAFTSNSKGGLGELVIAQTQTMDRPPAGCVIPLVGRVRDASDSGATYGVFGHITSTGFIYINSMLPNVTVTSGDQVILTGEWYTD